MITEKKYKGIAENFNYLFSCESGIRTYTMIDNDNAIVTIRHNDSEEAIKAIKSAKTSKELKEALIKYNDMVDKDCYPEYQVGDIVGLVSSIDNTIRFLENDNKSQEAKLLKSLKGIELTVLDIKPTTFEIFGYVILSKDGKNPIMLEDEPYKAWLDDFQGV